MFGNRRSAGEELAEELGQYKKSNPLVLAIPRGGIVVAEPVVLALECDWNLIMPRKLGHPLNPEVAIGAIAPDGTNYLNENFIKQTHVSKGHIKAEQARQLEEINRRTAVYKENNSLPDVSDRTVILVDDGIATGYTALAAIKSIQRQGAARVVLAVPVAALDTLISLEDMVDDVVCLIAPVDFGAVGNFYDYFEQTTDQEVLNIINKLT